MSRCIVLPSVGALLIIAIVRAQLDDIYAPSPPSASLSNVLAPLGYDTFGGSPDPEISNDTNRVSERRATIDAQSLIDACSRRTE